MSYKYLSDRDLDRVIEMAWEDRTPFEAILFQFDLSEAMVIKLMRSTLKTSSFKRWRKRVNSGVSQKHLKKETLKLSGLNVPDKDISQEIESVRSGFDLVFILINKRHDS